MSRSVILAFALTCGPLVIAQTSETANRVVPAAPQYHAITVEERLKWFASSSFGPASLTGGLFSAGLGTWANLPKEYGTHWEGFGDRYGMRLTGVVTSNAMEAGLGALWGEDPRYRPAGPGHSFGSRLKRAAKMTFVAENSRGGLMPAYGRFIATAGSNFLSNTWREPSEADTQHAISRTGLGFLARFSGNLFAEFWPSIVGKFRGSKSSN